MIDTETETPTGLWRDRPAAAFLGVSPSWLAKDRTAGRPPVVPYIKLGRSVRYSPAVLRRIVEGRDA